MSADLYLAIPLELTQYQIFSEEDTDDCSINDKIGLYLISEQPDSIERAEYYSANGELLKRSLYEECSLKKEIYFNSGKIGTEKEFDKSKVSEKKTFNKEGNLISKTLYVQRNGLIISIIKKKDNNEYKISYSYDDAKRIINRTVYINQEQITRQIYDYDNKNRIIEYRDGNKSVKICKRSPNGDVQQYIITDILGNKIVVNNYFEESNYITTEIILNEHSIILKDTTYIDNLILNKPAANENDLDSVVMSLYKPNEQHTKRKSKVDVISDFIKKREMNNNILPITIRKHALVI